LYVASALSFIAFSIAISTPGIPIVVGITSIAFGFFVNFASQISYQVAIEVSYPVPEAISTNIQVLSLQLFGMFFIILMSLLENSAHVGIWIASSCVCVGAIAMLFYRGKHKRMQLDLDQNAEITKPLRDSDGV